MPSGARIAVSLPRELLKNVERLRRETGETRSALVQRALRDVLAQKKRAEELRSYVEGYRKAPETPDEVAAAEASAARPPRGGALGMRRGDVWWAELPLPAGRRPVVLLSRDEAYAVRELVTIAPVTTRTRGLPVEVPLGKSDGMPRTCTVNVDTITTIPKRSLVSRIAALSSQKIDAVDAALRFALGLS